MRWPPAILALTAAAAVTVAAAAAAAAPPLVQVRARPRLRLSTVAPMPEGGVRVAGEVVDAQLRSGVPDRRVEVIASGRGRTRVFVLETDAHGRFDGHLPLGHQRYRLRFSLREDRRYGPAAPVLTTVDLGVPIPRGWVLLPLFVTVAGLLLVGLGRLRPWRRGARRARPPAPATRAPGAGLRPAGLGRLDALRPRDDLGFTGLVTDVQTARPIAGARLALAAPTSRTCQSDRDGRFALESLPAGRHEATVAAPGYVTVRFAVDLPHRGELRDARIDLMPVRLRVLETYRAIALGLLADPARFDVWTPHEILRHVRGDAPRPDDPLPALTALVCETYYSGRPAGEAAIVEAERLAGALAPAPRDQETAGKCTGRLGAGEVSD